MGVGVSADDEVGVLLRAAQPGLLRLALLLTGDRVAAEDLTQETFAKAWAARRRLLAVEKPHAYLRQIMVNQARRQARRHRQAHSLPSVVKGEPDHAIQIADRDQLGRALRLLPVGQRTAVVLRHYEHLSEAETASVLGCSVGNVKSQTSRGIAALRRTLSEAQESRS